MTTFITCNIPKVEYLRGEIITNDPINLSLVHKITKARINWYPDNTGIPSIQFHFAHGKEEWAFRKDEDRDLEFEYIMQRFGVK